MPKPHPDLLKAISAPSFRELLPRLLDYARRRLREVGWAESDDRISAELEAEEVIHDAIESCLEGEREWKEGVSVETFLCNTMRSQVGSKRRTANRRRSSPLEDVADRAAPSSRRDEVIDAPRILAIIRGAVAGDAEANALCEASLTCDVKRAALAAALGWPPERVTTVRKRINRRLAAAGLLDGDDDE